MNEIKNPLVSVCITAYNHVDYISECLDSILSQRTNFSYEVILGEDSSNDGTREICIKYRDENPDKVHLFLHSRETVIYIDSRPTGRFNFTHNISQARGKYVALCDGDDYWTDPCKLQRQVDFLEANDDFAICFHPVDILEDGKLTRDKISNSEKNETTILELAKGNFIHTPSCLFRNGLFGNLPNFFCEVAAADYPLHMLNAAHGKIKCLPDSMAVYRVHSGGVWSGRSRAYRRSMWINLLDQLIDYFEGNTDVINVLGQQRLRMFVEIMSIYREEKTTRNEIEECINKIKSLSSDYIFQYLILQTKAKFELEQTLNEIQAHNESRKKTSIYRDLCKKILR